MDGHLPSACERNQRLPTGVATVRIYLEGIESVEYASYTFTVIEAPAPVPGGGDLAGGPRYRVGWPDGKAGPRLMDGTLQSDMLIVSGVQTIATFGDGNLED